MAETLDPVRVQKPRAFSEILRQAGKRSQLITSDEKTRRIVRHRLLADHIWEAVSSGHVVLADGDEISLSPKEWIELVKWLYGHLDGPPKQELDVSSLGKQVNLKVYAGFDPDEV